MRSLVVSFGALFLLLVAGVGQVWADVGVGSFSVAAASPGDHVNVTLQGCTAAASDVRISLGSGGAGGSLGTLHDVAVADTTTPGTFAMVVPRLKSGTYLLGAACPASGQFGFYGAELKVTALPDTSTADPTAGVETGPRPIGLLLTLIWIVAAATLAAVLARADRRRIR
jgi:hypothetical protein